MEANAPSHEAFVTVDKRPGRPIVLPANSAGQVRTSGRLVQRLVEVQKLAEIRVRLRVHRGADPQGGPPSCRAHATGTFWSGRWHTTPPPPLAPTGSLAWPPPG